MSTSDPKRITEEKDIVRQQWADRAAAFSTLAGGSENPLGAATDLLLAALSRRPGMRVLDVASGVGDPALSVAAAIAPAGGHVTATDLVPEMLNSAAAFASERGITNVSFQQADAEDLPFPDATFDAVTCRFAIMLFPDIQQGLSEMRRVLAADGQLVCMVWGPPEQEATHRTLAVARQSLGLPDDPPSDKPHRFRLSKPGALAAHLRTAGFQKVTEQLHTIPIRWPGTEAAWWAAMLAMNEPLRLALDALDTERQAEIMEEVLTAKRAAEEQEGGVTSAVVLATAVR